jgi:hypothetical protein
MEVAGRSCGKSLIAALWHVLAWCGPDSPLVLLVGMFTMPMRMVVLIPIEFFGAK